MKDLKQIIFDLNRSGLNDAAIVRELISLGVETTQPTINRIKHGIHKRPRFDIGLALLELHRKRVRLVRKAG